GFSEGGDRGGQRIEFRLGRGHETRQLGRSFARGRRGDRRGERCVVLGEGRSDDAACSQKGQGSRRRGLQSGCPVHRRRAIRGFGSRRNPSAVASPRGVNDSSVNQKLFVPAQTAFVPPTGVPERFTARAGSRGRGAVRSAVVP